MAAVLDPNSHVICINCGHSARLVDVLNKPGTYLYAPSRSFKCTQCGEKFARFDYGPNGSRFVDLGEYGPDEGEPSDPSYDDDVDGPSLDDDIVGGVGLQEGWGGYEDD